MSGYFQKSLCEFSFIFFLYIYFGSCELHWWCWVIQIDWLIALWFIIIHIKIIYTQFKLDTLDNILYVLCVYSMWVFCNLTLFFVSLFMFYLTPSFLHSIPFLFPPLFSSQFEPAVKTILVVWVLSGRFGCAVGEGPAERRGLLRQCT